MGARYLYRKLVGTYLCKGNCRPIDFCPVFRSFCNGDGNLSGVHVMPSLTGDVVVHLDCGMVGFLIVIETVVRSRAAVRLPLSTAVMAKYFVTAPE